MRQQSDIPEIRQGLNGRIGELCRSLLPRGRLEGGCWVSHNPNIAGDDRKTPALKVRVTGGETGAWTDHRNGRDGHKGDALGLIAFCMRTDTKGALTWARDFLGLQRMTREERQAMRFAAEAAAKKEAARNEEKRAWQLREADRLFFTPKGYEPAQYGPARCLGTAAGGEGSAAERHARDYFRGRNCALSEISTFAPENFRFSGGTEWWTGAEWKTDGPRKIKVQDGPLFPALHSAMRSPIGVVTACHVTFLDPLEPKKAPVGNPKLMFGLKKGAMIEIAHGPARQAFWQTQRPARVVICEGIETGASLAGALADEARVWAAGDINNMGEAPVWMECVSDIVVARDTNAGNPTAQQQLDQALEKLAAHGKPMAVMKSHVGDDFNDLDTGKDD